MPSHPEINMLVDRFAIDKQSIEEQLTKAISAMQKFAEKKQAQVSQETGAMDLLPEPETVTLTLSLNKIPMKMDYRFREIAVPHPVIDITNKSVCLLAKNPKERAVDAVAKEQLPIEKIIALNSLKKKYATFETKQELGNRYELFFCDQAIYEMMGKLLGKFFFQNKKAKIPIPLPKLTKAAFDKALSTARFRVRGGAVVGVRIGNRAMDVEKLVANAMAVVEYMATTYCTDLKTKNNVFNIAIGATNLIDLPIWSVPVKAVPAAEESTQKEEVVVPVAVTTPKKETPVSAAAPVADIASVPIKKLKEVQKQRVEAVKAQLEAPASAKKKQRRGA